MQSYHNFYISNRKHSSCFGTVQLVGVAGFVGGEGPEAGIALKIRAVHCFAAVEPGARRHDLAAAVWSQTAK